MYRSAVTSSPSAIRTPAAFPPDSTKPIASTPRRSSTPRAVIARPAISAVSVSSIRGITQPRRPMMVTRTPRSARRRAISMPMNPAPTITAVVASPRLTRPMISSAAASDLKSCTPSSSAPSTGAWRREPLAISSWS